MVTVTYKKYEVTCSMKLSKNPKYDAYLQDREGRVLGDAEFGVPGRKKFGLDVNISLPRSPADAKFCDRTSVMDLL